MSANTSAGTQQDVPRRKSGEIGVRLISFIVLCFQRSAFDPNVIPAPEIHGDLAVACPPFHCLPDMVVEAADVIVVDSRASYDEVTLFMNSIPARWVMAHSVFHRAGVRAARMTQGERTQAEAVEDMAAPKLLLVEDGLPPAPDRARAVGNAKIAVLRQSSA